MLVDGARLELAFPRLRPWVIPLYEPPSWGEMRESNSRNWIHNPAPKPFGQSRHRILELLAGFPPASTCLQGRCLCMSATAATSWSWHAASNCGWALTMRLLFPLSYTSGAGAAIRTPITGLRGPRSPTELHQHKTSSRNLEAVGRIALPMISFAGRRLAVLATPPQTY